MSRFVFFVQLEPDVDHLAPIAYRLNKDLPGSVTVISVNPLLPIKHDHRLRFLRQNGVTVTTLAALDYLRHWRFLLSLWLQLLPAFLLRFVPQRVWSTVYQRGGTISPTALRRFFSSRGTKVVTIDEGLPMPVMKAILAVAHGAGLPSVRVPTANPVLVRPSVVDETDAALAITHQLRPHELAPLGPLSGPPTRETAIGCMRFCREWESINEKLLAELRRRTSLPEAPGKLKVLIFERTTQGFTKKHPVVQKLLAMDSVEVLYRSRPRITRPWKLYSSTVDALPSALLIQWADVVVCSVSSIALDVLYYQKPLLYAKFLAPAQTATYENFGAAWTLRSEAELLGAIEQIRGARGTLPYAEAQVKEFFHAAVYLGDPHYDVLGGYSRFYRTLAGD